MITYGSEKFNEVGVMLGKAKMLAIEYRKLINKPLGVTSEIAEFEVAKKLKCDICEARTPGYDLIDTEGKKVQVKGRVIPDKKSHRVPTIQKASPEKPWDYVVLVLFDINYKITGFYKADEATIEAELEKERPKGGQKRRNMPCRDFVNISEAI